MTEQNGAGGADDVVPEHVDARYRSLFFDHPHAVFSLGLNGRFVEANAAAGRLTGHDADDLIGTPVEAIVCVDDLGRARAAFAAALERRPQRVDVGVRRPDGGVVDLEVTTLPLVVGHRVLGVYGIAEDVTARNRVARDLEVTRQLAARASTVKSDFLARASHEIRTPLTGILAAAELLGQTRQSAEQRPLLVTLQRSGRRLMTLIDNVLDLAIVGAADEEHLTEEFDLHALIRDATDLADASARLKGLRVRLDLAPDVPRRVRDHPTWTSQVLCNLLSNAVNFTDSGEIVMLVSTATGVRGGESLIVRVKDTGVGIDPSDLDLIWEPFGRSASARTVPGAGVGLAVVKQLVAISGGSIAVDSTPGRGSTFSVVLPIRVVSGAPA